MPSRVATSKVVDGRSRIVCSRCNRTRYIIVPLGVNEKLVRCQCGVAVFVRFDHRAAHREMISRRATLIFLNGWSAPVYLCDYSIGGVSFVLPALHKGFLTVGQELFIQYPTLQGQSISRKIRLKNIRVNRVGVEFIGYPEDSEQKNAV